MYYMGTVNTADQILDIAQDLCQRKGFDGFSFHDIARLLDIKTASVHYHYKTKSDLGVAMMRRYRCQFIQALTDISSKTKDPKKQLNLFLDLMTQLPRERKLCLCLMFATGLESISKEMQNEVQHFMGETERWLEKCLATGKKEGRFEFSKSPRSVAHVLLASMQGMIVCSRATDNFQEFEKGKECLVAFLA